MMKLRWLGILTVLLLIGVSAACGPECPEGQTNCGQGDNKLCVNTKTDRSHCGECGKACESGLVCNDGKCDVSCQKDLTVCEGTCVNTQTDVAHCGACGTACKSGQICKAGKCEISCPEGQTACGETCTNTDTDPNNCGACDTKCEGGQLCTAGKCEISCIKAQTACEGACVDTQSNYSHCGACGTKCKAGEVCNAGKCETSCQESLTDCSGSCVNAKTDNANCGACGTACKAGELCKDGKCEINCADGATDCSGKCADTKTDRANCGACGTACKDGEICKDGKCEISCATGATDCSGKCVDLQSDAANCGKCGEACPAGEVCNAGKCDVFCQKGFTNCSGSCVDLQSNAGHCGKCGDTCPTGQVCGAGKCVEACAAGELSCSNGCTDISNDAANCGACNQACKTGEVCLSSKCVVCNNCPNWATSIGGADSDYVRKIAVDAAGNTYMTGYFYDYIQLGNGQSVVADGSSPDIFVAKFNPTGKALWIRRAGGTSTDYGYGVSFDSQGNVLVTGGFQGTAEFGATKLTSAGGYDIFVAKLDKDGKWLWAKGYGSTSSDYGYGVGADSTGAVYVTGYYYNTVKFGATSLTATGSADIFLLKLDDKGVEQWAGSAGSSSADYGYDLAVDSSNNVYITGRFYSTISWGTVSLTAVGSSDVFVAKFDSKGAIQWANSAGGSSSDNGFAIAVDANGTVVVGGDFAAGSNGIDFVTDSTTTPPTTINIKANGSYDSWVAQLDKTGKWAWAVGGGSPGSTDYIRGVGIDSKGNVWAAGYFSSSEATFGTVKLTAASSSSDGFILQLDKTGKILGAASFGGTSSDYVYGLAIDGKDNVYVGGYGSGVINFGQTQVLANGTEIFLARYNARTEPICPGANPTICNNACTDIQSDVKNCGACNTLCPAGNFCSAGKCVAPPANLFLQEYHSGACCSNAYFALKNYGTTDQNIGALQVLSLTTYQTAPETYNMPNFTLKAGATVYFFENSSSVGTGDFRAYVNGSTTSSNIYASNTYDALIMLCFGPCNLQNPGNTLDAMVVGTSTSVTPPSPLTFFANPLPQFTDSSDADANSYIRTGTTGKYPTFSAGDWKKQTATR